MELKTTKVYVPTHEILKDGWVNLGQDKREFVKIKEGYLLTKEELERVIRDACNTNFQSKVQESCGVLYYETLKQDYINQILK